MWVKFDQHDPPEMMPTAEQRAAATAAALADLPLVNAAVLQIRSNPLPRSTRLLEKSSASALPSMTSASLFDEDSEW